MGAIFCDSFDHYASANLNQKWNGGNGAISTTVSRTGPQSLQVTSSAIQHLTIDSALGKTMICGTAVRSSGFGSAIMGFSFNPATPPNACYFGTDNAGVPQFVVPFGGGGTYKGGAQYAIHPNVWYRFEMKVKLTNDLSGTVELRINTVTVLLLTGIQTASNSGGVTLNTWSLTGPGGGNDTYHDDVYLCDSLGSVNNDFLGDVIVVETTPNLDGFYGQWTPVDGPPNYAEVDSIPPDETKYVSSDTIAEKDTYSYPAPAYVAPATVPFRQALHYAEEDIAGTRRMAPLLRQAGVDFLSSSDEAPSFGSYVFERQVFDVNPVTGVAWNTADLPVCELGQQITG